MNGTQRSDWWREPGVRRSASSSYKTADCYSSSDYSHLDLQQAEGPASGRLAAAAVWGVQLGLCSDFFVVRTEWMRLEKEPNIFTQKNIRGKEVRKAD